MRTEATKFDLHVIRNILVNNTFGITEVNDMESLKSIFFINEEYSEIERLIKSGNIEVIREIKESQPPTGEYLEIILFKDQNKKRYIVTVYDSNALEQDPQIIEIYQV
jgi:hypothetical protein